MSKWTRTIAFKFRHLRNRLKRPSCLSLAGRGRASGAGEGAGIELNVRPLTCDAHIELNAGALTRRAKRAPSSPGGRGRELLVQRAIQDSASAKRALLAPRSDTIANR